jgi:hypothetical protein
MATERKSMYYFILLVSLLVISRNHEKLDAKRAGVAWAIGAAVVFVGGLVISALFSNVEIADLTILNIVLNIALIVLSLVAVGVYVNRLEPINNGKAKKNKGDTKEKKIIKQHHNNKADALSREDKFWKNIMRISVVCISLIVFIGILGLMAVLDNNGKLFEHWDKVDQEYQAGTYRTENTGNYNITYTSRWICSGGQDYLSCVNQHVSIYNSVCVGKNLTASANSICNNLNDFIDETKSKYYNCGYDCKTVSDNSGNWGWQYLDLTPETHRLSNHDAKKEISHSAFCIIKLGVLEIGECS